MLRANDELQLVHDAGRDAPLTWSQHVPTDDGDIDLAITDTLFHDPRVRNSESDGDPGVSISKTRDKRRQHLGSRGRAGANDERSVVKAVQVSECLPTGGERCDDACRVVAENAAGLGQRDRSGMANE